MKGKPLSREEIAIPLWSHAQQIARVRPARPCGANDTAIGGGCWNCGWKTIADHPEIKPALRIE